MIAFNFLLGFLLINWNVKLTFSVNCQPIGQYQDKFAVISSSTDRYFLISVPLHTSPSIYTQFNQNCASPLDSRALLIVEALFYSKDTFFVRWAQRTTQEPLGLLIVDNCGNADKASQDLINFDSCTLTFSAGPNSVGSVVYPDNVVGYLVIGTDTTQLHRNLEKANIPPKPILKLSEEEETPAHAIRALALVLHKLQYKTVSALYTAGQLGQKRWLMLKNYTDIFKICIQNVTLPSEAQLSSQMAINILKSISEDENSRVLILLTDSAVTRVILNAAASVDTTGRWHWIGFSSGLKGDDRTIVPPGSLMLAREYDLTDFYGYLNAEKDAWNAPWVWARNPWLKEYWSNNPPNSSVKFFQENNWLQYNDLVSEVIAAYDAASFALSSGNKADSETSVHSTLTELRRISLSKMMILNYRHTSKGWRFVRVGTVQDGSRVELDPADVQTYSPHPVPMYNACPSTCTFCHSISPYSTSISSENRSRIDNSDRIDSAYMEIVHRLDLWAYLLTGFSCSMLMILFIYQIYSITKICHRFSRISPMARSSIFLCQILLCGLFLQCLSIFSITLAPNFPICLIRRFLPCIGCILTHSILFTKLLVLINFRKGQYFPVFYQILVIVFFLITQIIINVHWFDSRSSNSVERINAYQFGSLNDTTVLNMSKSSKFDQNCALFFVDYLKMLILPFSLIILCAVIGLLTRDNPYNHRETIFIAMASFASAASWSVWIFTGVFMNKDIGQDASFGYGLLTSAFLLTVLMFLPSSRQNTAIGRVTHLDEDPDSVKSDVSPSPTWMKYLINQSTSISPIITQQSSNTSKSTSSKIGPSGISSERPTLIGRVHVTSEKTSGARGARVDPNGSVVTLDIPSAPNPMSIFNSYWERNIGSHKKKAVNTSYHGGTRTSRGHKESKSSNTPKPVFPSLLTPPAWCLNGKYTETDRSSATVYPAVSDRFKVQEHTGLGVYPSFGMNRSRSSQDFRQCRKRNELCLHSIRYRSRSFTELPQ